MTKFIDRISDAYEIFCRILLLLMTVLIITFVFMRYLFGVTFVWAEELITMLFISTTYFGAVIGMKYKEHITIGFFYESVSGKRKLLLDIVNNIVILFLQVAIVYISVNWISKVGNIPTTGMRIPIGYIYFMMPFSAVLIGLYCVLDIAKTISCWGEPTVEGVI